MLGHPPIAVRKPLSIHLTRTAMDLKSLIRDIPDFPKPGILFRDITTLLAHPKGLAATLERLVEKCHPFQPDVVLGMESRGFMFGVPVAHHLGAGFVPVRKPGKLPARTYSAEYDLEYGTDRLEMHCDAFSPGSRVLVIDDLIATGGTAQATANLVERAGGELVGFAFVVELRDLGGRSKLPDVPVVTLVEY